MVLAQVCGMHLELSMCPGCGLLSDFTHVGCHTFQHMQALVEEVEAGQEKLSRVQKHADACEAKISALEQQ